MTDRFPQLAKFETGFDETALIEILQKRSEIYAQQEQRSEIVDEQSFVHFCLGDNEQYGIPYQYAEEVVVADKVTLIPCAPGYICGVINHRGEMLPVVDLRAVFQNSAAERRNGKLYVVVVKAGGLSVGIAVNELYGNKVYSEQNLAAVNVSAEQNDNAYVIGICEDCITILNVEAILSDL